LIERFFIVIDGILVFHGLNKTKKCFCPANYFGDQCQWPNQRISLTLQLFSHGIVSNKMTFQLIIMLIDEDEQITSMSS
jgi:hypothetical protein